MTRLGTSGIGAAVSPALRSGALPADASGMSLPLRRRARLARCAAAALLVCAGRGRAEEVPPPRAPIPRPPPQLQLEIEAPTPNELIGADDGKLMVAGRALTASSRGGRFDVMALIDTSASTSAPSGSDIDGDGIIGDTPLPGLGRLLSLPSTDPGDSVLAAEIAAVRTLIHQLDPGTTHVGVIAFAGDSHKETPDAKVVAPLTDDYSQVETALDGLLAAGPRGRTNIQDAVLLVTQELTAGPGALSHPRPDARKVALLMTDGHATLPDTTSRPHCARLAILAAGLAAEHHIRIDTFAVGRGAADEPWVTVEMAKATSGVFTPVVHPGDLIAAFEEVRLTDISGIQINNLTSGQPAEQVRLESDGWFGGFVGLVPGRNRIEIRAFSSDGRRIIRVVDARLARGAAPQVLSPQAMARRTRMLEARLDHTRSYTLQLEAEKREKMRGELEKQMREKRRERSHKVEIEGEHVPAQADQ